MNRPLALIFALFGALWPTPVLAGLHPVLSDQLDTLDPADMVRVLVVLDDQADVDTLDRSLRGAKAARGHRHRTVVTALRSRAASTQGPLLDHLDRARERGEVAAFTPHWLINAVAVEAAAGFVIDLAERPGVATVEPWFPVALIEPVPPPRAAAQVDSGQAGLTPGVQAIGAPRVWNELGIDGTGTLVGIIDTGVHLAHPALNARWLGHSVPVEHAWSDDARTGDLLPEDRSISSHGTHVMGTLMGQAPGDTIGVAPGARWIASNAIHTDIEHAQGNILAALEFMTDPDGDPTTSHDVPDVVQNSWGVHEGFPGYYDCDTTWWQAMDNCEAAGVVLVFSAGNEGPADQSLRSPADRAMSFTNAFSVGATEHGAPFTVADFSARGPSACRGPHEIKPEVVAPGVEILSAQRGGGYQPLTGTSMAGPHVAGVIALMRQADPDLEVAAIKEILMGTAVDMGPYGEDNTYGHGMIDAYEAVLAVMTTVGSVEGVVTDVETGLPLEGARVGVSGRDHQTVTDQDGRYRLTLVAEPLTFEVSHFGYHDGAFSLTVAVGQTAMADHALSLLPSAVVTGTVTGPEGLPAAGAEVGGVGLPIDPAVAGENGRYSLVLPRGPGNIYELRAVTAGLGPDYVTLELLGDTEVHFELPAERIESFESGDLLAYPWWTEGDATWFVDSVNPTEGSFSASSGDVANGQYSRLEMDMYVAGTSELSFHYRVSSERFYDHLLFLIDDRLEAAWSGEHDWNRYAVEVPRGHHQFAWVYFKDVAFSSGEDRAVIDFVTWPITGPEVLPRAVLRTSSLIATLGPNQTKSLPLTLSNEGELTLEYDFLVGPDLDAKNSGLPNPVPHRDLDKGEIDPRAPVSPAEGAGGPDLFGYTWQDDTWFGGPQYDWVDIRFGGTYLGLQDDDTHGPIPLGFDFSFYGHRHDRIWIGSNGNLLFGDGDPTFVNQGIPDPYAPNEMIAPFWDDLNPVTGGGILYRADPGRFIVQYQDVRRHETGTPVTFQAILEADGTITFQYLSVPEPRGSTVGLENGDGDDGTLVQFNGAYLSDEMAIRFTPPAIWASTEIDAGLVAPGATAEVMVTLDSSGLETGRHVALLAVATNDPDNPELILPLVLTVDEVSTTSDPDLPRALVFGGAVPNPFNPATELHFGLPEAGEVSLRVFDISGRLVRVVHEGRLEAGSHRRPWDGRDGAGRPVASGTYFARLVSRGASLVKPLALVR